MPFLFCPFFFLSAAIPLSLDSFEKPQCGAHCICPRRLRIRRFVSSAYVVSSQSSTKWWSIQSFIEALTSAHTLRSPHLLSPSLLLPLCFFLYSIARAFLFFCTHFSPWPVVGLVVHTAISRYIQTHSYAIVHDEAWLLFSFSFYIPVHNVQNILPTRSLLFHCLAFFPLCSFRAATRLSDLSIQ